MNRKLRSKNTMVAYNFFFEPSTPTPKATIHSVTDGWTDRQTVDIMMPRSHHTA